TYEKAGLEVPQTWADLEAAGPVFKKELGDEYSPLGVSLIYDLAYSFTLQKTGMEMYDEDGNIQWTESEWNTAYTEIEKLSTTGVLPTVEQQQGSSDLATSPLWVDGRIAGAFTWSSASSLQDAVDENQELVVVPLLEMEDAQSTGKVQKPTMSFAISENCKYKDQTAEFLGWLVSSPEATKELKLTRGPIENKEALETLDSEGLLDDNIVYDISQATKDIEKSTYPIAPDLEVVGQDEIENIRFGTDSVDTAVQKTLEVQETL
ncbi:MAG: ABC transporter substrate-binding protein, partial [Erysipelotrichaceae bacterium]